MGEEGKGTGAIVGEGLLQASGVRQGERIRQSAVHGYRTGDFSEFQENIGGVVTQMAASAVALKAAAKPATEVAKIKATGETNTGPRLGPRGVDPAHHNANVTVRNAEGGIIHHERVVSGNMTPQEQALGFPRNTLASHTEARAVRNIQVQQGQSMTITGQRPPCPSCKGAMNATAGKSGATIRYQWRQDGGTARWTANQ